MPDDNLTQMLASMPVTPVGNASTQESQTSETTNTEQSLTAGDVQTTDAPDGQEQTDTSTETTTPEDAEQGNTSLNNDANESGEQGDKKPKYVPYDVFAERNNKLQAEIDKRDKEIEAARLGFSSADEYDAYDNQAKTLINPFTQRPFSGIKEYKAAESQIAAENAQKEAISREYANTRQSYVDQFGEEYGNRLADAEERLKLLEMQSIQSQRSAAVQTIESNLATLVDEYKDQGLVLDSNLRNQILRSHPEIALQVINGMRNTLKSVVVTPDKKAELEKDAIRKYQGEKTKDTQRVGAKPQGLSGSAQTTTSDGKSDVKAVRSTSMSELLGLRKP